MINPTLPTNETQRQSAVNKYIAFNGLSNESYDNIAALVANICDVPVSIIAILDQDRNYYKSSFGLKDKQNPRETSFCAHTILSNDEIMIVNDSRTDERFADNPFVLAGSAIFYAGVPLLSTDGFKLGTLCVYDTKPRALTDSQIAALIILAKQVMILFEKEYQNNLLIKLQEDLQLRNDDLERFAGVVSHDLKSPLANIMSLIQLLEEDNNGKLSNDSLLYLNYLKISSSTLRNYIDGILSFYKSDSLLNSEKQTFDLENLLNEITQMVSMDENISIKKQLQLKEVTVNKAALQQVLLNLISNAIKYNSKINKEITIEAYEEFGYFIFTVADNGNGIDDKYFDSIFNLFQTIDTEDLGIEKGSGIGLATVKKVVKSLGGSISVSSKLEQGTVFKFSILK